MKDGKELQPYVMGEYWSGSEDIEKWVNQMNTFTNSQIAAFDFALQAQGRMRHTELRSAQPDRRRLGGDGAAEATQLTPNGILR